MDIRKFEPIPTRPCKYCLALQEDSVFADFDVDPNGCLYLVRISFDGYGCCEPQTEIKEMDVVSSEILKACIENNSFQSPEIISILRKYFRENRFALWEEALVEHELI
ncbi:hypothetical protein [Marinomonas mediterranea]|jgi:hypothetical protein|uniref:Uncharacterized protein n=1 Tax=Marinomonas mediterranea (strain ATCC 700492 / JCM 21426 / NBRC 103028 / MMB-1) TaxID=717774 RepID=F2JWJ5_MARM1|nr:hypothetical protein [Marinomonas mediterranea]ADZ90668.1 hypothetical protein Marme_1396 [Marinomonas mediterranea MMB-1]WCN08715.1 hypothetical protein GV055_07100 [Marinomonas mediterranea]WCN12763.1 hypothetical protein GV054_06900 [Marinomonas mediterranea]WCN16834.1 hypothetical protein GV053_07040 [Marinomonas mediterranea MMB-1]